MSVDAGAGKRSLQADALVKAYRQRKVVAGLSLSLESGEVVGPLVTDDGVVFLARER